MVLTAYELIVNSCSIHKLAFFLLLLLHFLVNLQTSEGSSTKRDVVPTRTTQSCYFGNPSRSSSESQQLILNLNERAWIYWSASSACLSVIIPTFFLFSFKISLYIFISWADLSWPGCFSIIMYVPYVILRSPSVKDETKYHHSDLRRNDNKRVCK